MFLFWEILLDRQLANLWNIRVHSSWDYSNFPCLDYDGELKILIKMKTASLEINVSNFSVSFLTAWSHIKNTFIAKLHFNTKFRIINFKIVLKFHFIKLWNEFSHYLSFSNIIENINSYSQKDLCDKGFYLYYILFNELL